VKLIHFIESFFHTDTPKTIIGIRTKFKAIKAKVLLGNSWYNCLLKNKKNTKIFSFISFVPINCTCLDSPHPLRTHRSSPRIILSCIQPSLFFRSSSSFFPFNVHFHNHSYCFRFLSPHRMP